MYYDSGYCVYLLKESKPRDWSRLSRYGKKEYKFVQRDSYSLIREDYPFLNNGVCMGVVMSWIQEKLTTSNGFLRPEGHLRPSEPRQFAHPLNPLTRLSQGVSVPGNALTEATLGKLSVFAKGKSGARNAKTMRRGADNQLLYEFRGVDAVAQNLGLIQNHDLNVKRVAQRGQGNSPVVQEGPTIANATLDLQNGSAMLIELEQDGVGQGMPLGGTEAARERCTSLTPIRVCMRFRARNLSPKTRWASRSDRWTQTS